MIPTALQWQKRGWLQFYRRCRACLPYCRSDYGSVAGAVIVAVAMVVGIVVLGGGENTDQNETGAEIKVPLSLPDSLSALSAAAPDSASKVTEPVVTATLALRTLSSQSSIADDSIPSPKPVLDTASLDQSAAPTVVVALALGRLLLQSSIADDSTPNLKPVFGTASLDQSAAPTITAAPALGTLSSQSSIADDSTPNLKPVFGTASLDQSAAPTITAAPLVIAAESASMETPATKPEFKRLTATVSSGDSLSSLFKGFRIPQSELALMVKTSKGNKKLLSRLSPGQQIEMEMGTSGQLRKFMLHLDPVRVLRLTRVGNSFDTEIVEQPIEWRITTAHGMIENSLYASARRAGLSRQMIEKLIDILGWDIDFVLDVRAGDHYKIVYDEPYVRNKKINDDRILAVEFTNQGKVIRAVRYTDPDGYAAYFTPDGLSMRKEFLRSPVAFSRISSRFNLKRLHPVMHKVRAHRGVDYVAARGMPVKSTADGRIISIGRNGGYGKTITVQHGSNYSTLYAHLLRYKKGIYRGKQIRQGDIIGYVGKTGLATGYHLHYEFRVNGVHKDPLRFNFPQGASIEKQIKSDFFAQTNALIKQLISISDTRLASLN